jgi:signal transduction histidine kinase
VNEGVGHGGPVRTLFDRHPVVVDVALVGLLLAIAVGSEAARHGPPLSRILSLALIVPLLARRRAPVATFAVIALLALVQWLTVEPAWADVALLVALYTVAATRPRTAAIAAACVLEVGVFLAVSSHLSEGGAATAAFFLTGMVVAATVLGRSVQLRRAYTAALEDRAAQLEVERDQQGLIAAAAERARIAREMHDVVAHNLSVMIALADGAGFTAADDPARAADAMAQTAATGRSALTEMRGLLGVLRDDGEAERAPQPGIPELDTLVESVRTAGLPVALEISGPTGGLPAGVQLTVFRLVQEALTNTLKHAGAAARASVALRCDAAATAVDLEVADTGHATAPPAADGRGLAGMRERAALYAGTVAAGPGAGGEGWLVRVRLRIPPGTAT